MVLAVLDRDLDLKEGGRRRRQAVWWSFKLVLVYGIQLVLEV